MSPTSYQLLHSAILFLKCVAKVRLYFVRNKYFLNKFEKTRFRKYSEAWQSFVEIIYIKCQYFRGSTGVFCREYCCTLAEVLEYSAGNIVECKGRLSFFVYKKSNARMKYRPMSHQAVSSFRAFLSIYLYLLLIASSSDSFPLPWGDNYGK